MFRSCIAYRKFVFRGNWAENTLSIQYIREMTAYCFFFVSSDCRMFRDCFFVYRKFVFRENKSGNILLIWFRKMVVHRPAFPYQKFLLHILFDSGSDPKCVNCYYC